MEELNKMLLSQQGNYKELLIALTERHVKIRNYLYHMQTYVEKVFTISKENVLFNAYLNDKSVHESNIIKFDKIIHNLTETIQVSQARISDNEENLFKEQLRLLSTTLDPSTSLQSNVSESRPLPNISSFTKFRCNHYECSEEFSSKSLLEEHLRNQHNNLATFSQTLMSNNLTDDKVKEEFLYVPQMELEVLEYSDSPFAGSSHSTSTHEGNIEGGNVTRQNHQNGSFPFKKMARCDICSKYFNKHYLEAHRRSHSGEKPFKCSISGCNRTFTQSSSRNFHEKRFHRADGSKFIKSESSFDGSCEEILNNGHQQQQNFQEQQHHMILLNSDRSEFEMHAESPLKEEAQQQQQQNVSHSLQELSNHEISTNGKSSKTSRISKSASSNLLKHICLHCGKSFAYKMALKQHSLMHGEKNFRCTFSDCNYASYWKHNLELHFRKHQNSASNGASTMTASSADSNAFSSH
ncbi:PREDICTED: zinc finger protein 235-like [Rhagoletis zephyria]|uniref:zinc finger protein 235-like n=1 Tax=Rhagoletis zephyria TaxID=28612 RepID=UPI0008119195|nr:PREDICTED: zinc finger protein 235-like [Rhagoletis zephyria]